MASSVVYVVSDFGGEWEDSWEYPTIAFTDEGRARECAAKREARRLAQRLDDEWDDYTGSEIKAVRLVIDGKSGMCAGLGHSALKRLVKISERVAKGEPLEFFGARYVPEGGAAWVTSSSTLTPGGASGWNATIAPGTVRRWPRP